MNKDRRKAIADAMSSLSGITGLVEAAIAALETARDDEQDYFDAMPEGFQQSDRGQNSEAAVASLEEAIAGLETINTTLEEVTGYADAAAE